MNSERTDWKDPLADSILLFVFAYLISARSIPAAGILSALGVLFLGTPLERLADWLSRRRKP